MSDVLKDYTTLRSVRLIGMPQGHAKPLWTLLASAPHFMAPNALSKTSAGKVTRTGITVDHAHLLRTVALDWPHPPKSWARPALLDLHVIVGAPGKGTLDDGAYDYAYLDQELMIAAGATAPIRTNGNLYYSIPDSEPPDTRWLASSFAHVLAQPLDTAEPWSVSTDVVRVPPLRAVAGRIGLHVKLCDLDGKDTAFGWLRQLHIRELTHEDADTKRRWANLWLTPDGIEFDAADLPFPHAPGKLDGRVLLGVVDPAVTRPVHALTLLEPHDGAAWLQAWRRITPDAAQEESLRGFALKADRRRVPAFRWRISGGALAAGTVDIPGDSLLLSLVSPPVRGSADGSARMTLDWLQAVATTTGQGVRISGASGISAPPGTVEKGLLQLEASPGQLRLHGAEEIVFAINDDRLAQDLRRAYGLPAPTAKEPQVPLVPAFFPLRDGWLQVPVPNLALRDTRFDAELASGSAQARSTVLDGYFRIRRPGAVAAVQTAALPGEPYLGGPPFELALTRAAGLAIELDLHAADGAATPLKAHVMLRQASVLAQGLAQVAASAPDAFDALPRLSDGPGRIIPLQMRAVLGTADENSASTLLLAVSGLDIRAASGGLPALGGLLMDVCLNEGHPDWVRIAGPEAHKSALDRIAQVLTGAGSSAEKPGPVCPAVAWLRNRRTAAAASLPMTRSAAAAVRPLESRDLFPYVITLGGSAAQRRLATLRRTAEGPFYDLPADDLKPVVSWPRETGEDRGVFFAVIGVPGLELRPQSSLTCTGALRLDLPSLDEAFATAELPRVPGAVPVAAKPVEATSLDWPALAEFWSRQERKLQNARVDCSYATAFFEERTPRPVKIGALVKGLEWATDFVFETGSGASGTIDYGHYTLGGVRYTANRALLGLDARFMRAAGSNQLIEADEGDIAVLGFSASTFDFRGVQVDNALAGIAAAQSTAGLITRTVVIGDAAALSQVTLATPLACRLQVQKDAPQVELHFWFKDVLCRGNDGVFDEHASSTWTDALTCAARSLEWRLYPADDWDALKSGRDRIRVSGFELEPLRLRRLKLAGGRFAEATVRCRLTLGPDQERTGRNEIDLVIKADGRIAIERDVAEPLRFVFTARTADATIGGQRALELSFVPDGASVLPAQPRLDYCLGGAWIRAETVSVGVQENRLELVARSSRRDLSRSYARLAHISASVGRDSVGHDVAELHAEQLELALIDGGGRLLLELGGLSDGGKGHRLLGALALLPTQPGALTLREADGCIVLDQGQARLELSAVEFALNLGLAVGFAPPTGGDDRVGIPLGHCRVLAFQANAKKEKVLDGVEVEAVRVDLRLSAIGAAGWGGEVVVDGCVHAENSIAWPALDWPGPNPGDLPDDGVPVPLAAADVGKGKSNDGRGRVILGTTLATHTVQWRLNGHRFDLSLLARLAQADVTAVCSVPVAAEHLLQRDGQSLRWGSVEGLAFGHRRALIPAPAAPGSDHSTFAARYRDEWKNGQSGAPNPGMSAPGRGSFATVLQGALSDGFRRAAATYDGYLLVGGFVGLVPAGIAEATAPLLRLPVLAGLGAGVVQSAAGTGSYELAWADGPAARPLRPGRPSAPEPANDSSAAIEASLVVRNASDADAALDSAILVEQTYAATPIAGALAATPYFLGAAIGVERVLRQHARAPLPPGQRSAQALSVVAGRLGSRRFVSVLRLMRPLQAAGRQPISAELSIVGARLTRLPWTYMLPADETPLPLLRRHAGVHDLTPRAGLLVQQRAPQATASPGSAATISIRAVMFASTSAPRPAVTTAHRALFPDQGRGPLAPPQVDRVAAPLEGRASAVRDTAGSGIAGLARRLALPRQARGSGDDLGPADNLLWVAQSRVPAYLALRSRDIEGPPIHWLTPAPARVRLPVATEITDALSAATSAPCQAFLPSESDVAELGERAGIVTVRRTRTLAAEPRHEGFDPDSTRFGRLAQASSSFARMLRTPRPGALPANVEPALDRRIQASALRRNEAIDCLVGNADTVAGTRDDVGDWAVRVRAEASRAGIVSDRWDGSLRLRFEIEVAVLPAGDSRPPPQDVLATLLFNDRSEDPLAPAPAAQLRIGDLVLPMRLLRLVGSAWNVDATKRDGHVDLLLYPGEAVAGNPVARADIAAALSGTALPPVELQLTLHPSDSRKAHSYSAADYRLPVTDADSLAIGGDRPPLTLRLALFPVTETRGALPLLPLTLLFRDPAFDRDLAGEPASIARPVAGVADADADAGRGRLQFWLQAERPQIQCGTSVSLMLDLRYEMPLSEREQLAAGNSVVPGGDLLVGKEPKALLRFGLDTAAGTSRWLKLGSSAEVVLPLAKVAELSLTRLRELDGSPAVIEPGDQLVIQATLPQCDVEFWSADSGKPKVAVTTPQELRLRLTLSADPVSPPPSALYAAIERCERDGGWYAQLLAHAQSPLPWRTDLIAPARDFRRGVMRRSAVFAWTVMRPHETVKRHAITVIKQDRNGQTWIPEEEAQFSRPLTIRTATENP